MKKYFLFLFILPSLLLLYDCTSDSKAGSKILLPKALPPLSTDSIYSNDLVVNYIFDNEERDIDSVRQASKRLFLQAIDLYKNKKNFDEAIPAFKKSIALYPEAKAYNELGNLLFEKAQYDECLKAYSMAVNMNYSPLADTYFNMACAEASVEKHWNINTYLENAFKNGFRDSARYVSDQHLQSIRSERYYNDYLLSQFRSGVKQENIKFDLFLKEFSQLEIPFAIKDKNTGAYDSEAYISYDYSEFVDEMENVSFGRDVSNEFCHIGVLKHTDNYTALLYSSVEMMGGDQYNPVYTMIVTYNPKGEQISKKVFACQCSAEKIKVGSYDGSVLTIEEKTVNWEKPFNSIPPDENKIIDYTIVETTNYTIDESGTITTSTGS